MNDRQANNVWIMKKYEIMCSLIEHYPMMLQDFVSVDYDTDHKGLSKNILHVGQYMNPSEAGNNLAPDGLPK